MAVAMEEALWLSVLPTTVSSVMYIHNEPYNIYLIMDFSRLFHPRACNGLLVDGVKYNFCLT